MRTPTRYAILLPVSCLFILICSSLSLAQSEFTYLRGKLESPEENDHTNTLQCEYLQVWSGPLAFSFSYLNEGHLSEPEKHHRDGFVFQLWARKSVFAPWFTLGAGAGPYHWYDTQLSSSGSAEFVRGFGIISSVAANIHLPYGGLYLQGRINWVKADNDISTKAMLIGIGTNFSSAEMLNRHLPEISEISNNTKNEVALHFGHFTRKSLRGIEYRRNLGIFEDHIEITALYLYKEHGFLGSCKSYGATAQIWAVNKFMDRYKFGIGTGLFCDLLDSQHSTSNIVSYLFAFQISNHWNLQYCRSRIPPNLNNDEDIRTISLGYLF